MKTYVSRLKSILRAMRSARMGCGQRDKLLIFMLIAFETTSFANTQRRARLKNFINCMANHGLVYVRFKGLDREQVFILRADNAADYSVASELFLGGYSFPDFTPRHIVDGGANIGLFSVTAADRFPQARIDCYEPNRDNIDILRRNLSANSVTAAVHDTALWSREMMVNFVGAESHTSSVVAREEAAAGYQTRAVLPKIGDDCWLKLDIEGAEYEVLPALFAAGRFPRWISAELHNYHLKGDELKLLLAANNYSLFQFPSDPCATLANVYAVRN